MCADLLVVLVILSDDACLHTHAVPSALAAQLVETAKRRLANMQPGISADAKR